RAALNPIRKVGDQIEDVLRQHVQTTASDRGEKAIEALEQVKIARPRERYHAYPFELSGGMCQRVVIALALACNPQLLIADEPTTGLDVTTQKAVMDLIVELTKRRGMSTILITHDLGLAAAYCDRVIVMEKGRVVETALSADIFAKPQHAYTRKLMRATPRLGVSLRDLLPEEEAAALTSPRMRGEVSGIHQRRQLPGESRQHFWLNLPAQSRDPDVEIEAALFSAFGVGRRGFRFFIRLIFGFVRFNHFRGEVAHFLQAADRFVLVRHLQSAFGLLAP